MSKKNKTKTSKQTTKQRKRKFQKQAYTRVDLDDS